MRIGKREESYIMMLVLFVSFCVTGYRQKLIATPYAPLVQEYQKCYDSPTDVFLTQLGVSWANIEVLTPFFVIAFLACIILYQRFTGYQIPTAYSKRERDDVLNALAISLLMARDRIKLQKYGSDEELIKLQREHSNFQKNQTLQSLIADLENDADYHLNTYKLDDEVKELRINWQHLGKRLYQTTISPIASSLSSKSEMKHSNSNPIVRDSVTAEVVSDPTEYGQNRVQSVELTDRHISRSFSRSNSLSRRNSRRDEIIILNENCDVSTATASIGFTVHITHKKEILLKLDELYDRIYEISQQHLLYSHQRPANSIRQDYEPYFQAIGFLKDIDRSTTQLYEVAGRLSNISIDSDDEEEDSPRMPMGEFLNEFFEKIYQLLMLHTSITMDCLTQEQTYIRQRYGDTVAYNVSGTILTINDLFKRINLHKV